MDIESNFHRILPLYKECLTTGGIWLSQPEHILSFKLLGKEKMHLEPAKPAGKEMINTYRWLQRNVRDIIDESDEVFDVKYQLIYAMGQQKGYDHTPHRWEILMDLFRIVGGAIRDIAQKFPQEVEFIGNGNGAFPTVRILTKNAGHLLVRTLANRVIDGELQTLPRLWAATNRAVIYKFLIDPTTTKDTSSPLLAFYGKNRDKRALKTLLLLRGILAHGVFLSALSGKRWRVNFGIDQNRRLENLFAVPFRAKDSPALRSEFSHPDMIIILTCLVTIPILQTPSTH